MCHPLTGKEGRNKDRTSERMKEIKQIRVAREENGNKWKEIKQSRKGKTSFFLRCRGQRT
jgi:hypothetical protein